MGDFRSVLRSVWVVTSLAIPVVVTVGCGRSTERHTRISVDYEMAERTIDWLEFVASGADDDAIRDRFFAAVAPTEGCQAILDHWSRFRVWDAEHFYTFILEGLGRIPVEGPLRKADGSPSALGMRRALWSAAAADPAALRGDLAALRRAAPESAAVEIARRYLPDAANVTNRFFVVLFGGSSAFSVGESNGYDLLQLPKDSSGGLDVEQVVLTFAHEMHHSGFADATENRMMGVGSHERLQLVGILAAEGMAACFVSRLPERLETVRGSSDPADSALVADWDRHLADLRGLYTRAAEDVRRNLAGELTSDDLMTYWIAGSQGPAYVLGADMCATVEAELGIEAARSIAEDYRRLLQLYNRAARRANRDGSERFLFDDALAGAVGSFRGL